MADFRPLQKKSKLSSLKFFFYKCLIFSGTKSRRKISFSNLKSAWKNKLNRYKKSSIRIIIGWDNGTWKSSLKNELGEGISDSMGSRSSFSALEHPIELSFFWDTIEYHIFACCHCFNRKEPLRVDKLDLKSLQILVLHPVCTFGNKVCCQVRPFCKGRLRPDGAKLSRSFFHVQCLSSTSIFALLAFPLSRKSRMKKVMQKVKGR